MGLLHIFDSSDSSIIETAGVRGVVDRLPISDASGLASALDHLVAAGSRYNRVLFETHGSPGCIYFHHQPISAAWWRAARDRHYANLTTAGVRVYFNGCNVAEGASGWEFLRAVVPVLVTRGGEVFGQTSTGYGNRFNGHVVHFWGSTRTLFVDSNGRIAEYFEQ